MATISAGDTLTTWIRWLYPLRLHAMGLVTLLIVMGALPGVFVWAVRNCTLAIEEGRSPWGAITICGACWTVIAVLTAVRTAWTRWLTWEFVSGVRQRVLTGLLTTSQERPVGAQVGVLLNTVDELQYVISGLITAVRNPISIVILAVAASWMAPMLSAWVALMMLALAVVASWTSRWNRMAAGAWQTAREQSASTSEELLGAADLWRSEGAILVALQRFQREAEARDRVTRFQLDLARVVPRITTQLVLIMTVVGVIWAGDYGIRSGSLTAADLVGCLSALLLLRAPISGVVEIPALLSRADESRRVLEAVEVVDPPSMELRRCQKPRSISAVGLTTTVSPSIPFDLDIAAGEWVAIVGASGAGKSTLLRALAGIDQTAGVVSIEGSQPCATARVWAAQHPPLFSGPLRHVLDPRGEVTDDHLLELLSAVGLLERVQSGGGLHGQIAPRGGDWSGGEGRRIGFVRAMAAQVGVVMLDEPTSGLNAQHLEAIISALERDSRTRVVVTHSLQLAKQVDRVVWLENGAIHRVDVHDALWEEPAYRQLWS